MKYLQCVKTFLKKKNFSKPKVISITENYHGGAYGIIKDLEKCYFFKIKKDKLIKQENNRSQNAFAPFITPKIIDYALNIDKKLNGIILYNFQKDLQGTKLLFNLIHNPNIKELDKKKELGNFWDLYLKKSLIGSKKVKIDSKKLSNSFLYEKRLYGVQCNKFYGKNFYKLWEDIRELMNEEFEIKIKSEFTKQSNLYRKKDIFLINFLHGDLHDFNITINSFGFIDLDYSGENSLLGEVVSYYWYAIAQSPILIPKYKPEFAKENKLFKFRVKYQKIALSIFKKSYFLPIIEFYDKKKIPWENEFYVRLMMRILGVQNILLYDIQDRKKIYQYMYNINLLMKDGKTTTKRRGLNKCWNF